MKMNDFKKMTDNQKLVWSSGDFNQIARLNWEMSEKLVRDMDPKPRQRVLDVACGSGTAALVAERRFCEVTGLDYVPSLIDRARFRAEANGQEIDFIVGDAQQMPFTDNYFDCILSVYGVQFAPDQELAASELIRVCKPGGIIGLAGPADEGWSKDFFATHARYNPPPPDVNSPLRWGTEQGLAELFRDRVVSISTTRERSLQYYRTIDHAVEIFSTWFGPTLSAMVKLNRNGQQKLLHDLKEVFIRYNRATDGAAVVENRYQQTLIKCR
jgi:SAM-dependent methyltransferase